MSLTAFFEDGVEEMLFATEANGRSGRECGKDGAFTDDRVDCLEEVLPASGEETEGRLLKPGFKGEERQGIDIVAADPKIRRM
jgi:hypothetical protein